MRILHVTPTFHPAVFYGGPIASTYASCNALARLPGVSLKVLTTDAAGPAMSQRVNALDFPMCFPGGYDVYFTRRRWLDEFSPGLLARLVPMVRWADVVHLTGVYSLPTIPTLAVARLVGRPVLWSPRGSLLASDSWSQSSRQNLKRVWERACSVVMPRRTLLHVTSEEEKVASQRRIAGVDAVVIPNGTSIPERSATRAWQPQGMLRIMFLGRIDPVKGIENLIGALARLPRGTSRLDLFGAGSDSYIAGLKELTNRLGLSNEVRFHGHAGRDAKRTAFEAADLLVLPSYSENFGMVVAEALAHGVPVIVSRGVPWADVERHGCGRWVDNSSEALGDAISGLRGCDLAAMGALGRAWMLRDFDWNELAGRTLAVYQTLAGKGKVRPAPVDTAKMGDGP